MDQAVLDAINIFYKLKGQYDREGDKLKAKIMNRENLTMAEKRDLYLAQKRKCIQCKKPVGTIFKITGNALTAMCGAAQDPDEAGAPCNLNIKIQRGQVVQLPNYVNELREKHKELVHAIMKIKYNLLFKYAGEEETVSDFERSKEDFDQNTTLFDLYKTKLIQITSLLAKREQIAVTDLQILEFIKEIKAFIEESTASANPQLLKDAVELYIHRVLPVLQENQGLKYAYQAIEPEEEGEFRLVQKPFTPEETEVVVGDGFKVQNLKINKK
jgi:hypothetical protein